MINKKPKAGNPQKSKAGDNTEHKLTNAALLASEKRYRSLFENMLEGFAYCHMIFVDGRPQDFVYLAVNAAFERLTGLQNVVGKKVSEVIPGLKQTNPELFEIYGRVAATGAPEKFETYVEQLAIWFSISVYSTEKGYFVAIFENISERNKAEEEIRRMNIELEERVRERTAALEAANKELEAFSYSVSHDLRAPLRGIDGWSEALIEEANQKLSDTEKQYLNRVRSETQRLGELIEALLQLAHINKTDFNKQVVNLSSLAEKITVGLKEKYPNRNTEVIIQSGMEANGDAKLLEAALTNLMDNAWKFSGTREQARIEFGALEKDNKRVFYVRDNGVGFDMRYADKLFGAFQRLHKMSEFPGHGVGLATVQRIVHRHGGYVWAEAKVDQGATFYFTT